MCRPAASHGLILQSTTLNVGSARMSIQNRPLSQAARLALASVVAYEEANHDLIPIEWGEIPSQDDEEEMVWKAAAKGLELVLDGQVDSQDGPQYLLSDIDLGRRVSS